MQLQRARYNFDSFALYQVSFECLNFILEEKNKKLNLTSIFVSSIEKIAGQNEKQLSI